MVGDSSWVMSVTPGRPGRPRLPTKAALAEHAHDVPLVLRAAAVVGLRLGRLGCEPRRRGDRPVGRLGAALVLGGRGAQVRGTHAREPDADLADVAVVQRHLHPTPAVAKSPSSARA